MCRSICNAAFHYEFAVVVGPVIQAVVPRGLTVMSPALTVHTGDKPAEMASTDVACDPAVSSHAAAAGRTAATSPAVAMCPNAADGLAASSGPAAAMRPDAANNPTATSGPAAVPGLSDFPSQLEQSSCEEEVEGSDAESFTDDDLSSWGSDKEIWGSDSDYYGTDEEEEALAGQKSHLYQR